LAQEKELELVRASQRAQAWVPAWALGLAQEKELA
jgi:hypothetical protein